MPAQLWRSVDRLRLSTRKRRTVRVMSRLVMRPSLGSNLNVIAERAAPEQTKHNMSNLQVKGAVGVHEAREEVQEVAELEVLLAIALNVLEDGCNTREQRTGTQAGQHEW